MGVTCLFKSQFKQNHQIMQATVWPGSGRQRAAQRPGWPRQCSEKPSSFRSLWLNSETVDMLSITWRTWQLIFQLPAHLFPEIQPKRFPSQPQWCQALSSPNLLSSGEVVTVFVLQDIIKQTGISMPAQNFNIVTTSKKERMLTGYLRVLKKWTLIFNVIVVLCLCFLKSPYFLEVHIEMFTTN